jgi:hypothetical protein
MGQIDVVGYIDLQISRLDRGMDQIDVVGYIVDLQIARLDRAMGQIVMVIKYN